MVTMVCYGNVVISYEVSW